MSGQRNGRLEELRALIGDEATLMLVNERGGRPVYVPEHPDEKCELAKIVGLAAATKLGKEFGRETMIVPVARDWRVLVYSAQGKSTAQIAGIVGSHIDTVKKIRAKHGLANSQLNLLDLL